MITYTLIASLILITIGTILSYRAKIWVLYFLLGGVGFSIISVYIFHNSLLEIYYKELLTKIIVVSLFKPNWLQYYPTNGVFLFPYKNNWVSFQLDVECLGYIEIFIFLALLIFYPPISRGKKFVFGLLGATAIFVINILRVDLILFIIKNFGLDSTYVSHTIIGRIFFFTLVIGVYWHVFTVETIRNFVELGETNSVKANKN